MSTLNLQQIDALCDLIKQTESEVKNLVDERLSKLDELEVDFNE